MDAPHRGGPGGTAGRKPPAGAPAIAAIRTATEQRPAARLAASATHAHRRRLILLTRSTVGDALRLLPPLASCEDLLTEAQDVLATGVGHAWRAPRRPRARQGATP